MPDPNCCPSNWTWNVGVRESNIACLSLVLLGLMFLFEADVCPLRHSIRTPHNIVTCSSTDANTQVKDTPGTGDPDILSIPMMGPGHRCINARLDLLHTSYH